MFRQSTGLSRRDLIKTGLRTGAYVAPAVLAASIVTPVAAASPVPGITCTQPIAFFDGTFLSDETPNTSFDVYLTLSTDPIGSFTPVGSFTTDAFGFGVLGVPVTVNTSIVTSYVITTVPHGAPPSTTPPVAAFSGALLSLVACTPGGPRAAASLVGGAFIEPTLATCGGTRPLRFTGGLNYSILNAAPNTAYDLYIQPDNIAPEDAFVKVTTVTTNGQGNANVVASAPTPFTTQPSTYPASVVVNAVLAGAAPTAAVLTDTSTLADTLVETACPGGLVPAGAAAVHPPHSGGRRHRKR